jgi:cytochrome c-type protein NapC
MEAPAGLIVLFLVVTAGVMGSLLMIPSIAKQRYGRGALFFPIVVLPLLSGTLGGYHHLERSKRTEFCLSCHTMSEHGRSLYVDSPQYLAAAHFQNQLIPRTQACYTCHTNYTMYGDLSSKWRGLRHVYVQYLATIPQPTEIQLYTPYNNRECLRCHAGARTFEEGVIHNLEPETLPAIRANTLSCLSSGCHEIAHDVGTLSQQQMWLPGGSLNDQN